MLGIKRIRKTGSNAGNKKKKSKVGDKNQRQKASGNRVRKREQ